MRARRALRELLRKITAGRRTADLDVAFYRKRYGDLDPKLTDAALATHFDRHGRRDGRAPNPDALLAQLQAAHGPLPDDFLPVQYRALHSDLSVFAEDWQLRVHYLEFGRAEARAYVRDLTAHEAAFARLRAEGVPRKGGRDAPGSFADLLRAHRLLPTDWLDRLNLGEFVLLNGAWLPRAPACRVDALCLFVEHGLERLAPIAVRYPFDARFYRVLLAGSAAGGTPASAPDDAALYRHWLNHGMSAGEPGTEGRLLVGLTGEESFPESFREDLYRAAFPRRRAPPPGRGPALRHLFETGFERLRPEAVAEIIEGPGAARLCEQLGTFHLRRGRAEAALPAFDRSLALEPDVGHRRFKRANALRTLGRERDAVPDLVAAAQAPDADVWAHVHAAEGLADLLGQPEAGLAQIERSAPTCNAHAPWRAAAHRVVALYFAAEHARAIALYVAGERAQADRGVEETLARITAVIEAADPLPAPLPVPRDGPIVLVANRDLAQCDHYRVEQKRRQLAHGGWSVEVYDQHAPDAYRPALDRARLVIFYRVAALPAVLHALLYARALGVPTLYEIDDLIFDAALYPDPFASFEGQITATEYAGLQHGVPLFRHAMRLCDAGLASTPALAEAMRPLVRTGACHVLRNGLDARNDAYFARPHAPFSPGTLTIFYGSGTKAHNSDFTELAAPALLAVMARHAHVRLVVAGHLRLDPRFAPFADRVRQLGFTRDVDAYWEVLSGADISLAVLSPSPTTDAKSEIKWLEAAMCAVPSIVSPTRTYREVLADGEDALFADTPEAWTAALERLVADPGLRRRIGEAARAKARARYGLDAAVEALAAFLPAPDGEAAPAPREPAPAAATRALERPPTRPLRVLFVNVFFPPQTYGGATRVLRDNVDHLIDHAAGRVACAVVAADDGAEPPYATRIDGYRGVPVYRIAPPRARHMDWRPFDPDMRAPFEQVLDRFDPDLVHVHCVQRLTGTVVEAARARGTPYVVTLHDAWWISDHQFLVDAEGAVEAPPADVLAMALDPEHNPTESIARRRRLGRLLDGARATVAVSETFAALYRAAGFARTIAIPNGISNVAPAPRRPSPSGRVRLGHIGNRSAHKGATLVELVLRATPFDNLALTLVDHAYESGVSREEVWGTTPVRIIGPVPQGRIGDLYAELDVLLAPSIWPESFGLVTREAAAAGLWVVASDRGAIGEDVVEGVNGFRVDVSGTDGLRAVLRRIDADPRRYLASPPPPPRRVRTAADQGADWLAFYESLARAPRPEPAPPVSERGAFG